MIKNISTGLLASMLFLLVIQVYAQERTSPSDQPQELGKVSWYRDYATAKELAKQENKSILIFFQEVPGCSTSTGYANNVLQHPLLVEAIETQFIPLAIFNNETGKDRKVLEAFNEPSWNNPVVRIVNTNGTDLTKRVAGDYTAIGLYNAMESALKATHRTIPQYMKLVGDELSAVKNPAINEKHYKMYCFWSGETHLGKAKGVLATEPGFMSGHEVVKVVYDTNEISEKELDQYAKSANFNPIAKNSSYRVATKDRKYNLQHTNYKYLPLTDLQKTKINSALGRRQSAEKYLSPKQLKWLKQLNKNKGDGQVLYHKDFKSAWAMKSSK
ncbi:MAG: VPGUxxT family thioredoxin-like (seleno)protein, type 2 [Bacteroidota bacterium]